ncbi:MAG: hypothetical protein ACREH8_15990 [Opitutaceae bacterium]
MPSRSVLNTATPPDTTIPSTADRSGLPAGLSVAPRQPGISPLSGLPLSDIPTVSRGTSPLGPEINVAAQPAANTTAESRNPATSRTTVTDPAAIAAHPQTNPQIGMGTTTVVPTPPPPAQPEVTPPAPTNNAGQAWVAGHYSWGGGQWTWVNGMWQRPPQPNATWIPGNYDAQNKRWTEGHWSTNGAPTPTRR